MILKSDFFSRADKARPFLKTDRANLWVTIPNQHNFRNSIAYKAKIYNNKIIIIKKSRFMHKFGHQSGKTEMDIKEELPYLLRSALS